SPSYTFTASASRNLVATFSQAGVTVTVASSPAAGGATSGGGTFTSGSSVTVTASPASCYTFVSWTENGTVVSTSSTYTFTAAGCRNLLANFRQITYTVSTTSSPVGAGSTSGGGAPVCGSSVTVAASASAGYSFFN